MRGRKLYAIKEPKMIYLRIASYGCFGVAALCVVAALAAEDIYFAVPAISVGLVGVLFLAFDRALFLLSEIRDALVTSESSSPVAVPAATETAIASDISQGLQDLSSRLDAMRKRNPT
jgi:hypothetical protein